MIDETFLTEAKFSRLQGPRNGTARSRHIPRPSAASGAFAKRDTNRLTAADARWHAPACHQQLAPPLSTQLAALSTFEPIDEAVASGDLLSATGAGPVSTTSTLLAWDTLWRRANADVCLRPVDRGPLKMPGGGRPGPDPRGEALQAPIVAVLIITRVLHGVECDSKPPWQTSGSTPAICTKPSSASPRDPRCAARQKLTGGAHALYELPCRWDPNGGAACASGQ